MDNTDLGQMVVENMDSIQQGVRAFAKRVHGIFDSSAIDDLVGDTVAAILAGQKKFNPDKGTPEGFCRMVAWQKARDAARSIKRGGQTSGYIGGYMTDAVNMTDAGDMSGDQKTVAMFGLSFEADSVDALETLLDAERSAELDAAVATLDDEERELYELVASEELDVAAYAAARGIKPGTVHVRKNRLIAKLRDLLAS